MWIAVTFLATIFQTLRTAAQARLRPDLSVNAASYVRYILGAPISITACAVVVWWSADGMPTIPTRFWFIVIGAGVAQIIATIALLTSFDRRDYAIGTVYSKTEVIQVAIFSAVLVGEPLRLWGWISVVAVLIGVIKLALPPGTPLRHIVRHRDRAAQAGALAGAGFALASVGIRWASTSLGNHPALVRGLVTLAAMNTAQTIVNGIWIQIREPESIGVIFRHWKRTLPVGAMSVGGSASWAIAMSMETAAKVRSLGQLELLLTFLVSRAWLHQRHQRSEFIASGIVLVGILGVTLFG